MLTESAFCHSIYYRFFWIFMTFSFILQMLLFLSDLLTPHLIIFVFVSQGYSCDARYVIGYFLGMSQSHGCILHTKYLWDLLWLFEIKSSKAEINFLKLTWKVIIWEKQHVTTFHKGDLKLQGGISQFWFVYINLLSFRIMYLSIFDHSEPPEPQLGVPINDISAKRGTIKNLWVMSVYDGKPSKRTSTLLICKYHMTYSTEQRVVKTKQNKKL